MNKSDQNEYNNPEDIFYFRSELSHLDTLKLFIITYENENLRVRNKNINCLYKNLSTEQFDIIYNEYNKSLNLNFEPLELENKIYALSKEEKETIFEQIITSCIYFYTINNLQVEVKRADFIHPSTTDHLLTILDKKYGVDTKEALALGAKILRQNIIEYINGVKGRRIYYDR